MYQYSEFDRSFVNQRVAHYRDQTQRYLDGKLSDDEFLQLRLRNGLYIQRLAPMLRVAVPYGTLSSKQLRAWRRSHETTTAAMGTSALAKTCSSTGRPWRTYQIFSKR